MEEGYREGNKERTEDACCSLLKNQFCFGTVSTWFLLNKNKTLHHTNKTLGCWSLLVLYSSFCVCFRYAMHVAMWLIMLLFKYNVHEARNRFKEWYRYMVYIWVWYLVITLTVIHLHLVTDNPPASASALISCGPLSMSVRADCLPPTLCDCSGCFGTPFFFFFWEL